MNTKKITFLGDIMCEPRLFKAAKRGKGQYDFSGVFKNVRGLLSESDYVIGNFETPLAGKAAGYVSSLLRFNAPDEFLLAANDAGIDLFLTANNHCLDRGIEGLKRTANVFDEQGIPHAGSFSRPEKRDNTYFTIGDKRFAVISYTYGTNYTDNRILLDEGEKGYVNLLRPQTERYYIKQYEEHLWREKVLYKISGLFRGDKNLYAKKYLGLPVNQPHSDDNLNPETLQPYLEQLYGDIDRAKNTADFVFFCPHIGGQFNKMPGTFSRYVFEKAVAHGVDAIIASHPHVVQEAEIKDGVPCFYSLGNFSMSPNSVYILQDNLPDYGIAVHLYIGNQTIEKCTFSILRIIEEDNLNVIPIDDLLLSIDDGQKSVIIENVKKIYETVTHKQLCKDYIRREYDLA